MIKFYFGLDLASSHYSKETQAFLNQQNVPYVRKENNPPNVPQLRPIETFWSHLKRKVYHGGWSASNKEELIKRIKSKLKTFGQEYFDTLMKNVKKKVRRAERNGLLSLIQ